MYRTLRTLLLILLTACAGTAAAQSFTEAEIAQGYRYRNDTVWFVFSEARYQLQASPVRVAVTGSFRVWSQEMADTAWLLRPLGQGIWAKALYDPGFARIPIRAEFKYRTDAGEWLQPPPGTPNEKGSNLVFLQDMTPPMLRAELLRSGVIWLRAAGLPRLLDPRSYRLTDAQGNSIPIAEVLPHEEQTALIAPAAPIDIRRVYYLEIPALKLRTWCSYDGWFRSTYSTKELGANVSADGSETVFRLFAPRATGVRLYLYREAAGAAYNTQDLRADADGVWETTVPGNLHGVYYDYTIHGFDDPGNHFYETNPVHVTDPYARVSLDGWGRARVWIRTRPAAPLRNGRPPMQDVISYEVHIQDFTDLLPVSSDLKGTLPAMTVSGLKNSKGEPIGFDHLVDLGINVVHLLPVQEFLHYPDEDWRPAFEHDPFMIEQGIHLENYQWGYRTTHAFAVESRYRRKGSEPGAERDQFRDLVQAFHDKGIAVIIDIVPNHTGENMDKGKTYWFNWNAIDKIYHYRTKDLDHIGEYGNEVKFETRPMVQRWLIDQCRHFIEEFGIDGFRIDLAGQVDRQTLIKLREALGPDIIIYGEPWIGSADPDFENNPSWDWYKHNSPITYFNDDARNAIKGPVGTPQEKERDRGYAGANFREFEHVKRALTCTFPDEKSPLSGISYLDIHDNWALADQFALQNWDGRMGVDEERFKIAALLLYTSLGPIVNHGGTEFMRSKGLAELKETVKYTKSGTPVYLHGKRDTYNMRAANRFVWENKGRTPKDKGIRCNYRDMYAFWRGLNRFRMSSYGQVFRVAEAVPAGYYRWVDTVNPYQLGYIVADKVFVLINTGSLAHDWEHVVLPAGTWRLVGGNAGFDHVHGIKDPHHAYERLQGGQQLSFRLEGTQFRVWVRD
ncbi:MAG: alpha-amylase family glycosyl hydrolase [Bacteroidia bacterium]|nr:alpha-amylase family glycosyl hydrolase [Bacteroidia bacterium]